MIMPSNSLNVLEKLCRFGVQDQTHVAHLVNYLASSSYFVGASFETDRKVEDFLQLPCLSCRVRVNSFFFPERVSRPAALCTLVNVYSVIDLALLSNAG